MIVCRRRSLNHLNHILIRISNNAASLTLKFSSYLILKHFVWTVVFCWINIFGWLRRGIGILWQLIWFFCSILSRAIKRLLRPSILCSIICSFFVSILLMLGPKAYIHQPVLGFHLLLYLHICHHQVLLELLVLDVVICLLLL